MSRGIEGDVLGGLLPTPEAVTHFPCDDEACDNAQDEFEAEAEPNDGHDNQDFDYSSTHASSLPHLSGMSSTFDPSTYFSSSQNQPISREVFLNQLRSSQTIYPFQFDRPVVNATLYFFLIQSYNQCL